MTNPSNKPAAILRDGDLKATIWRNEGEKGPFFSIQFASIYRDGNDGWQERNAFTGSGLLRLAHIASKAYDEVANLRSLEKSED